MIPSGLYQYLLQLGGPFHVQLRTPIRSHTTRVFIQASV